MKQVSEDLQDAFKTILEKIEKEDEFIRLWHLREFKKNNRFWHGFQYLFWSETSQDWRIPTHERLEEIASREEVKYIYDYVVNVFKAHGEAIIAALSTDLPDVRFGPADADDPDDLRAVKAASNASEMIIRDNKALLLLIQALFYLCTEGFVASYRYSEKDAKYGTIPIPQYGTEIRQTSPDMAICPSCGNQEPSVPGHNDQCQACGDTNDTLPGQREEVPVITKIVDEPKSKEIIEVYGPLNVRVPSYVLSQKQIGYLVLYVDNTPEYFMDLYDLEESVADATGEDEYERIMRSSTIEEIQYVMRHLVTEKRVWLRPSSYHYLGKEHEGIIKQLKKEYPDGAYFSTIGKNFIEGRPEKLDEHWTMTKAGPSKGIHADPILKSLVSIQELRNNATNYLIQTMEYGIPTDYADPEVFDFEGQQRMETAPGYVYQAKPKPGQSLGDSFYTSKTATLSRETTSIMQMLDADAQFTIGSFPSIFGGPSQSGSKTLGEYEKSRAFALQRLSLPWYFISSWWGSTIEKAVKSFVVHQLEDEKFTTSPDGKNFETKWIRQADFKGSFERLEPEVSSAFPMSFAQKRAVLMELAALNNPEINTVLYSPENAYFVKSLIGLLELKVPDEAQRTKQIREIVMLMNGQPTPGMPGLDGSPGPMMSSVPIEPDIDDDVTHMKVLQGLLVDDGGLDLKENNPAGYSNCVAHFMEHKQHLMMTQMPPPMPAPPGKMKPNGAPVPPIGLPGSAPGPTGQ